MFTYIKNMPQNVIMENSRIQEQPQTRGNAPVTDADIHSTLDFHTVQEITRFDDEVAIDEVDRNDQEIEEDDNPLIMQSIYRILERPRIISTFSWSTTDAVGALKVRLALPDALFESTTVWSKIQQFAFLHAGIKFQVRVNGTAYHYGQLLVCWRPACLGRTLTYNQTLNTCYDSLYSVSQRPHMLVSPSMAQVVEMNVPYQSCLQKIPLSAYESAYSANSYARDMANLGVLEVWILTPLIAMGETNDPPVTVTIYASFTNPSLSGYTHLVRTFVPSPLRIPAVWQMPANMKMTIPIAQARKQGRKHRRHREGKRTDEQQTGFVFNASQIATADFNQLTQRLALTETTPDTDDEYKLENVLGDWSLFNQVDILSTQTPGALLLAIPVHPSNCMIRTNGAYTYNYETKLSYISNLFSLWRGPIEYRFDFIASKFHSLRVKIAWYPPMTQSLADMNDVGDEWTQIVDVQGQISTTFVAPWIEDISFLPTDTRAPSRNTNGMVVVTLLNAISYPVDSAPRVQMNVWVRGPQVGFAGFLDESLVAPYIFTGLNNNTTAYPYFPATNAIPGAPVAEGAEQEITARAQGRCNVPVSEVDLNVIARKPTIYFRLFPNQQMIITAPMPELLAPVSAFGSRVVRLTSLLDYLLAMTLGYDGSVRLSALTPFTDLFVRPLSYRGYTATREANPYSNNPTRIMWENRYSSSAYFPSSVNAIKDFTLPNYSTLAYRPFSLYSFDSENFAFTIPGVNVSNLGYNDTYVTIAAGEDFTFYGNTATPVTITFP